MTEAQDKNDDQWLSALAGKPDLTSDIFTNAQAKALRSALQAQSHRMDDVVPVADDIQYQRLLFRLRQEGLTGKQSGWSSVMQWGQTMGQLAARVMTTHNTLAWGVAATAVLVIGVALQMNTLQQGQDASRMQDVFRSGGTVLIVSNPKARAEELHTGLKSAGTDTPVITGPDGQFQLRFKSSVAALEYLNTQRIEPTEVEGFVTLTITAPQKKP
jgi:hypothetical protein